MMQEDELYASSFKHHELIPMEEGLDLTELSESQGNGTLGSKRVISPHPVVFTDGLNTNSPT
jgi:hypothetical protein